MNAIVSRAVEAVEHAHTIAGRLARTPVSEATTKGSVSADNDEFTAAVDAARLSVEAAMDELDGPALTRFDFAVASIGDARTAYFTKKGCNRADAAALLLTAKNHVKAGTRMP